MEDAPSSAAMVLLFVLWSYELRARGAAEKTSNIVMLMQNVMSEKPISVATKEE